MFEAITVLWGLFTIFWLISNILAFKVSKSLQRAQPNEKNLEIVAEASLFCLQETYVSREQAKKSLISLLKMAYKAGSTARPIPLPGFELAKND
jgi:hypothetical protein